MKLFTSILAIIFCSNIALSKDLKVKIKGLKSSKGKIMIAVYDSEDNWLDIEKALFHTAEILNKKEFEIVYKDLKPGKYGVAVFHDENKDGELNFSFFPPGPSEGIGFYGMEKMGFGRPSWNESMFSLKDDMSIEIKLINP